MLSHSSWPAGLQLKLLSEVASDNVYKPVRLLDRAGGGKDRKDREKRSDPDNAELSTQVLNALQMKRAQEEVKSKSHNGGWDKSVWMLSLQIYWTLVPLIWGGGLFADHSHPTLSKSTFTFKLMWRGQSSFSSGRFMKQYSTVHRGTFYVAF